MSDKDELRRDIGKRVKLARRLLGVTQVSMAERCGVSVGTVSEVEAGNTMISVEFMLGLYQAFKVDPVWLLSGEGETFGTAKASDTEEERVLLDRLAHGFAVLEGMFSDLQKKRGGGGG